MTIHPRLVPLASFLASLLATFLAPLSAAEPAKDAAELRTSLLFHASFDHGPDADFAKGDATLWSAPAMNKRDAATKGLPSTGEVSLETDQGRFGGAIRFRKSAGPMVFFKADGNFPAPAKSRSGTVSFWLSTDPAGDLPDGYCDPLQITSKQWDDASFFVEFEKRPAGIPFRLGVYADRQVWNPTGRKFEDIPPAERPLVTVDRPPFGAGQWTHVAFTYSNFNSGKADGVALLYLNGKPAGSINSRTQSFTWDMPRAAIMLGLGYIGRMDDLATFDKSLSADEIATLFALPQGVATLRSK